MTDISLRFTDQDKITHETAMILATFFLASEFEFETMGADTANIFVDRGYIVVGEAFGNKSILDITHSGEQFLKDNEARIQLRRQTIIPLAIMSLPSDWTGPASSEWVDSLLP